MNYTASRYEFSFSKFENFSNHGEAVRLSFVLSILVKFGFQIIWCHKNFSEDDFST